MTDRQIQLVKNSWSYVIINSDDAGQLFYSRLFEVAPNVRQLFKEDTKEQARKLMNMVTLIVTKLHKLNEIMGEVKLLAQRHTTYGTHPTHYAIVGECLIWTLRKGLGDKWNDETEKAWLVVYGVLAKAMIESAKAKKTLL